MKTILITGSNRGIGLEYCRQLSSRGDEVIATCRSASAELKELNIKIETGIDISLENSMDILVERLQGKKIDVLINNAGILYQDNLENLSLEKLQKQLQINSISPLLLTSKLLGNLKKGSKVIMMSSRMGSIEDNTSGGYYGYRMSKVALCMAGKSLSIDMLPKGISVALLHPGLVSTQMTNFSNNGITTKSSVQALIKRIDSLTIENSGEFWHANGENLPW